MRPQPSRYQADGLQKHPKTSQEGFVWSLCSRKQALDRARCVNRLLGVIPVDYKGKEARVTGKHFTTACDSDTWKEDPHRSAALRKSWPGQMDSIKIV